MLEQISLFLIALLANTFSAFAGGGAGLLQLPILLFLGLPFSIALATHKIATVALGVGATLRYFKTGHLERKFSLFMLLTGLPGVVIGAMVILDIPSRLASIALGILTISLGLYSIFKKTLGQTYQPQNRDMRGYLLGGLGLFFIGFLNGSLTSGTGLFVTLCLIRWFGMDYQRAVVYTLILVGFFWNATGAVVLGTMGTVHWLWLPALLLGSILGGYLGAHLAISQGNRWIKRVFEVITILVGLKLLFL
jgi:uncharacterized membrane protein YfcA